MSQPPKYTINGRFLTQKVTGVQRFAIEMTTALQSMVEYAVLAPAAARDERGIAPRRIGHLRGHAWEQVELPAHVGAGVLLNLGNTGPVLRRRQVVVIHDALPFVMPDVYSWKFGAWYRLLQRALVQRGATIATVSNFARAQLANHLGLDRDAITVLSEGAEHLLRSPAAPGLHQRLGLTRPYVLAVGSLARHKNLSALSATASMLAERGMDLVLIGDVDQKVYGAQEIVLPTPSRAVGRMDDAELRALYEDAACFVFPSLYESFGLPAVEAMACSCPVVATRVGALPETCADAALLADPLDPSDIAAAVAQVLDDPACAARLRAAGLSRAAGFTWNAAAARLAALAASLGPGDKKQCPRTQ